MQKKYPAFPFLSSSFILQKPITENQTTSCGSRKQAAWCCFPSFSSSLSVPTASCYPPSSPVPLFIIPPPAQKSAQLPLPIPILFKTRVASHIWPIGLCWIFENTQEIMEGMLANPVPRQESWGCGNCNMTR